MAAVQRYFHDNYTYRLGMTIPPDKDPIVYFLLEQPASHCSYFASGSALLLRLGGVPCRYVTGLVIEERHPFADYWIGRNRDAHAWVEAWDERRGWQIVESTPSDGVPDGDEGNALAALLDYLRHLKQKLAAPLRPGIPALARDVAVAISRFLLDTWPGRACVVVATLVFLSWLLRGRVRREKRRRRPTVDPELARLLRRMDKRVARLGYCRQASETLHQFATRILREADVAPWAGQAAAWYRGYAAVRYEAPEAPSIATLQESLEAFRAEQ